MDWPANGGAWRPPRHVHICARIAQYPAAIDQRSDPGQPIRGRRRPTHEPQNTRPRGRGTYSYGSGAGRRRRGLGRAKSMDDDALSLGTSILLDLRRVACGGCGSNWGLIECWEAHPLDPSLTERQARLNRLMGGSSRNNRAGGGCPEPEQTKRAPPITCLPLRRLSKAEGGRPGRCSRQRLR